VEAKIGCPVPEFKAMAFDRGNIREVSDAEAKGKWLVLFFYPGDFTFV